MSTPEHVDQDAYEFVIVPVKLRRGNLEAFQRGVGAHCVHLLPESDGSYVLGVGSTDLPVVVERWVSSRYCGSRHRKTA